MKCPKCEEETNNYYIRRYGMCVNCIYDIKRVGKRSKYE